MAAVEAMSQGCPVVLAQNTALPEIGGEAGWYFDPSDVESIAGTLCEMLNHEPERNRRRGLGREIAASSPSSQGAVTAFAIASAVASIASPSTWRVHASTMRGAGGYSV